MKVNTTMANGERAWTPEVLESPHSADDKSGRVRRMFNGIAPRYEFVNSLFSLGLDRAWRRRAVKLAELRPGDLVLDIACGTGDFSRAFRRGGAARVVGCDFAHEMLKLAAGRENSGDLHRTLWSEADALHLPFRGGSFCVTSCAFGVRNFQDLSQGLSEMYRVLRPGGRAVILEFTRPRRRLVRSVYSLYSDRIMPAAATWISGDRTGAYRYLPRSVVSFLDADGMCRELRSAGFAEVSATPLTMGVVTVYVARRGEG